MNSEYQTSRLVLKILPPEHFKQVLEFQVRNKEIFEKYEPTRPDNFYTFFYQHTLLRTEYNLAQKLSTVRFYIFLKDNPRTIIGTICLHDIARSAYYCSELGYKFDSAYWHQGYAREALEKVVEIAFSDLNLHRLTARVIPSNTPSIRLLQSLNFIEEGLEHASIQIQGVWTDHIRFARVSPD